MIAPQQVYCVFELYFEGKNERQYLHRETSSIDVIAQKEVFGCLEWSSSIIVDDFYEIVELPVDVSHDAHRVLNLDYVSFLF